MPYDFQLLRRDVFGGLTSTVVALPVALAFGVASGLGAAAGLYGAMACGFFAAVFGGTRTQISGPTGAVRALPEALGTIDTSALAIATATLAIGLTCHRAWDDFCPRR